MTNPNLENSMNLKEDETEFMTDKQCAELDTKYEEDVESIFKSGELNEEFENLSCGAGLKWTRKDANEEFADIICAGDEILANLRSDDVPDEVKLRILKDARKETEKVIRQFKK